MKEVKTQKLKLKSQISNVKTMDKAKNLNCHPFYFCQLFLRFNF